MVEVRPTEKLSLQTSSLAKNRGVDQISLLVVPGHSVICQESNKMDEDEVEAKVVLMGASGVGKTSIVVRFVNGEFNPHTASTIGASFMIKKQYIDRRRVTLQLWDTAGQERFRSMAPLYYRGAHAAILVYDISQPSTFDSVKTWVQEIQNHASSETDPPAGNKVDMKGEGGEFMDEEAARDYAESIGAKFFFTSAKTNEGIEEMFLALAKNMLTKKSTQKEPGLGHTINVVKRPQQNTGCCG